MVQLLFLMLLLVYSLNLKLFDAKLADMVYLPLLLLTSMTGLELITFMQLTQ
jgi:hypothetical protein